MSQIKTCEKNGEIHLFNFFQFFFQILDNSSVQWTDAKLTMTKRWPEEAHSKNIFIFTTTAVLLLV